MGSPHFLHFLGRQRQDNLRISDKGIEKIINKAR
jgi:hypothetical protein